MALIVEDGTGKADAESYVSVADADTYHANRGNTAWAVLTTTAKEQALRRATDYMLQAYRLGWKGFRAVEVQALDWPRAEVVLYEYSLSSIVVDDASVPGTVKNACAELALKSVTETLSPDLSQAVVSETVGPISTTYDSASPQYKRYRAVDQMLRPYLQGSEITSRVGRA